MAMPDEVLGERPPEGPAGGPRDWGGRRRWDRPLRNRWCSGLVAASYRIAPIQIVTRSKAHHAV